MTHSTAHNGFIQSEIKRTVYHNVNEMAKSILSHVIVTKEYSVFRDGRVRVSFKISGFDSYYSTVTQCTEKY